MTTEDLLLIIESMKEDEAKFKKGVHTAGTRLRGKLQELKNAAHLYRGEILESQKAKKAEK